MSRMEKENYGNFCRFLETSNSFASLLCGYMGVEAMGLCSSPRQIPTYLSCDFDKLLNFPLPWFFLSTNFIKPLWKLNWLTYIFFKTIMNTWKIESARVMSYFPQNYLTSTFRLQDIAVNYKSGFTQ
jgi:hypothetical protein